MMIFLKNIYFFFLLFFQFSSYRLKGLYILLSGLFKGFYFNSIPTINKIKGIKISRRVVVQNKCTLSIVEDGEIHINEGVRLGAENIISAKSKIVLHKNVLTAARVFIADHNHEISNDLIPIMFQGSSEPRKVEIGEGTWIGVNVSVLPGVNLGKNCVVGSNSLVNKSFPDNSIIGGIPAKLIK